MVFREVYRVTPPGNNSVTIGAITGFGSVIVNGIQFQASNAQVLLDDATGTEAQLRLGMMVQVRGINNGNGTGTAAEIRYRNELEGQIESINLAQSRLRVLGQEVVVDNLTAFDNDFVFDNSMLNRIVEVSGLRDGTGAIHATRIELKQTLNVLEVVGTIANLDTVARRFTIGNLTLDYSSAALVDVPSGGLSNGLTVEAKAAALPVNGILLLTRLQIRDRICCLTNVGQIEVEGYITDFVSPTNFKVSGQAVTTDSQTIYVNGAAADLADGKLIEAEGTLSNGILLARKIVFKLLANIEIQALLQAKDTVNNSLTLLGKTIKVDGLTNFQDKSGTGSRTLSFAELNANDRLKVKAYKDSAANLVAIKVERTDADALVSVKGPLDSLPRPNVVIIGVTSQTGTNTIFRDISGALITADTFFGTIAAGTIVRVRGIAGPGGNTVDATRTLSTIGEVHIENCCAPDI